jgi:hypothetical protein
MTGDETDAPGILEMCLDCEETGAFKSRELNTVPLDASGKYFVHL